ncbi:MAG: hemagglutinin repeat-containing protein, partial [Fusobacterium sp.]|nr:hemagglutinin repeat-containing protein [Fusobacterium sp.]
MNTEVKNSIGSNILSKENISLTSEEDMKLKQANIQGKNITINSKKDILIESGVSTLDSKRSSQSLNGE